MRKITIAVLLLAALPAIAHAQQQKESDDPFVAEEKAKASELKIIDRQYKRILELRDKAAPAKVDPWRNMRSTETAKPNR